MPSPRSRIRAKLAKSKTERAPGNGPRRERRARPTKVEDTSTRLEMFPSWLISQLIRTWKEVCHNKHPFMLLFSFDMNGDPLTTDASAMVGSRLDVMLVKVNGGIYYEMSTHMDGLQARLIGNDIRVTPEQLLYVCSPDTHIKGATADLSVDISKLQYVAMSIPASLARESVEWDVPLDIAKHLPQIKPEV